MKVDVNVSQEYLASLASANSHLAPVHYMRGLGPNRCIHTGYIINLFAAPIQLSDA